MHTITEALSELKLIIKKIDQKQSFINQHIARQDAMKDPLTADGGQAEVIKRERQAVADLGVRLVRIRTRINEANASNTVTIEGVSKTVAEWLVWRREFAPIISRINNGISSTIRNYRAQAQAKGVSVRSSDESTTSLNDLIINVNEVELAREMEVHETIMQRLDGQLSLFNATTQINID